ncbi:putative JUN kinase activator protein [Saitoella complicata NRRL Y-17804]|uniref:COP9 signalosome complex subunit 5 n=1 Tax=Saitoella complicata (strain BCRC 22490 / CBS 7301 / JCM 7358 / NBRC 10748 / NRRL Y-17804) TaxID=698492 RepID=A0A0E9N7M7_SAICN|nr:putative JUN kinase activator protein [Saitoella complicata NRRL Y-17804]ODQ54357.1 putative JUN kinase activator protein [Saitoella complicata NRRL Y-17804]GAO45813.1 hypothetical protein G7K_0063-t1 [Saitoella complicata NRRL Y-17804]
MDAETARKTWEIENNIKAESQDALYRYDADEQKRQLAEKPWKKDPHWFQKTKISALALIKMAIHARSGGAIEVMGLMLGRIDVRTIIITDSFALPVEGTETRVNAQAEAYEYMVQYLDSLKASGRGENIVGWYHSHPGYGCWLSGIDVGTQMQNQMYQDPWLAVVIDPNRTISAGKVEIGAFRTYPENYTPPNAQKSEYQTIPLSKIQDFGVHANSYYPLAIEHFKSSMDSHLFSLLWNKYWVSTLSQSPLLLNRAYATEQLNDLASKIDNAQKALLRNPFGAAAPSARKKDKEEGNEKTETELHKVIRDSNKITGEEMQGLMSEIFKDKLFNCIKAHGREAQA